MSKKLTNNIYQFEDNETGWGSQMNQNLKALDDTIGELKNVYKKSEVDTELSNKQDKLTSTQTNAINSGIDSTKVSGYDAHVADTDIHVTVSDKANWNAKPNKSTTLSGYGITNAYTKTEIDNSIKDFATKSTTLGGYGITDAYTKTEIDTKLSSVYKYKGSVAQYLDLPTQNNVVGDVWNVSSNGMNYAWDGSTWDNLGATVDLSSYVKNTDYATTSKGGVVKPSSDSATDVVNGVLQATTKTTTQYNSADNSMFVSKGTLDNVLTSKDYATNTNLSAKANVSDVYTQAEVNNLVGKKADTTSVYTKTQIDSSLSGKQDKLSATQLSNIANVPNKANASDVYNKTDIDDKLDLKQDSLTQAQLNACNSGITATKVTNLETHTSNSNIHVTANDKNTWNAKQDALTSDQIANINSIPQLDSKYVKSDDTTVVRLNNLNEINLQEDHYNAWFGYRGGEVTNWKFGNGSEGGLADVYANDYYLNDEKLSEKLNTKANNSEVVHLASNETITGTKTFTSSININGGGKLYQAYASDYVKGVAPSAISYQGLRFYDDQKISTVGNHITGAFEIQYNTDGYNKTYIGCRNYADTTQHNYTVGLRVPNDLTRSIDFLPSANDKINLGATDYKWADVNTSLINGKTPAYDDSVVHNTSNETISGTKTFGENIRIKGSYKGDEFSPNARTALELRSNRDTEDKSGIYISKFRQNVAQGEMGSNDNQILTIDILENGVRSNSIFRYTFKGWENDVPTKAYFEPYNPNTQASLGSSTYKWADVNTALLNGKAPAYDDSVVHKEGDETISGTKSFSNNISMSGNIIKSSDNSALNLRGSTSDNNGAKLALFGKDHENKGNFYLYTNDGTKYKILRGSASEDSLQWGGKEIDCIDSQGDDWIRYSNGLQICWGSKNITTSTGTSLLTSDSRAYYKGEAISFGASFKSGTIPLCTVSCIESVGGLYNASASSVTNTKVSATLYGGNSEQECTVTYIAIGYWK